MIYQLLEDFVRALPNFIGFLFMIYLSAFFLYTTVLIWKYSSILSSVIERNNTNAERIRVSVFHDFHFSWKSGVHLTCKIVHGNSQTTEPTAFAPGEQDPEQGP